MVSYTSNYDSLIKKQHSQASSAFKLFFLVGCKVEMFYLNVEAVNTHRDRPLVSLSFKNYN